MSIPPGWVILEDGSFSRWRVRTPHYETPDGWGFTQWTFDTREQAEAWAHRGAALMMMWAARGMTPFQHEAEWIYNPST